MILIETYDKINHEYRDFHCPIVHPYVIIDIWLNCGNINPFSGWNISAISLVSYTLNSNHVFYEYVVDVQSMKIFFN